MVNPTPELVKQVEAEYKEILTAPPIMYGPNVPRCGFCGCIAKCHEELTLVESHKHGDQIVERHKGPCCG